MEVFQDQEARTSVSWKARGGSRGVEIVYNEHTSARYVGQFKFESLLRIALFAATFRPTTDEIRSLQPQRHASILLVSNWQTVEKAGRRSLSSTLNMDLLRIAHSLTHSLTQTLPPKFRRIDAPLVSEDCVRLPMMIQFYLIRRQQECSMIFLGGKATELLRCIFP